ncbi:hypothetical protein OPKNFCMD_0124 [Methylobacterium crusticola]|uniref:Uncharacterized protein n=1 Tax=Methylobacterium crusticola TaxID=1697972 RepID=A0ABQ4QQE1_9HYPH|nr:hypothetical protein [Methylobacterium crusticola]GJD47417.1 hypothetical protein OPKNFCMD_0124 [Methylobacterium crusticola]
MPIYRLRAATRDRHGMVGVPVHDRPIEAATVRRAAAIALGKADEVFSDETNIAWLVAEDGALVWTLRLEAEDAPG